MYVLLYVCTICMYIPELLTGSSEDFLLNEGVLFSITPLVSLDNFRGGSFGGGFNCFYKEFPFTNYDHLKIKTVNKVSINYIPLPLQKIRHNYQGINHEFLNLLKYLQTSLCQSIQQL